MLRIHEENYRYGEGELVLRVTAAGEVLWLDDGQWLMVAGVQIGWNGADACKREVVVRLSSLVRLRGRR